MRERRYQRLFIALACFLHFSDACQMDGVSNWLIPVQVSVRDVDRGSFFTAVTSDVLEITSISHAEGLNSGPYIDVRLEGSQFVISTNDAYAQYEENETAMSMGVTVNMRCTVGTGFLVFMINVNDTNNNAPQFRPSNELEFTIAPPVPPGFQITGCLDDIIARDIDLTTQRVEFEIDENPYFEIYYDAASSTVAKEFKAILRTTSFIRSLPEPVSLRIRATDVDNTGDPPLTSEATLNIIGNNEFELPEEPVFDRAFYLAEITGGQLQHEPIFFLQGYSSEIHLDLDGEYSEFFDASWIGNQVTLSIQSTLPDYLLEQTQIYLAVKAERNFTSGASATVILEMPEPRQLGFEKDSYSGIIRDNVLTHEPIVLDIGFGADVEYEIKSDFPYFNVTENGNQVMITIQTQIPEDEMQTNDFFFLSVIASGINTASASASVVVQTLKNDVTTPVFSKSNYEGTYFGITNFLVEDISLMQGFDSTVRFELEGEFRQYFSLNGDENDIKLSLASTVIPEDLIFNEKYFVLNVKAEKDLTVGATATVLISFPPELTEPTEMSFSNSIYKGSLETGQFSVEQIVLTEGFTNDVVFSISGEHGEYFQLADSNNNILNVEVLNEIPESVVESNNFLTLEVIAQRERATTAVASVVIDIVKEDPASPTILLFSSKTYVGSFMNNVAQIPTLSLEEPFNEFLNFTITGEYASYFEIEQENNQFTVSTTTDLPEEALNNTFITLDVEAAHNDAINGYATIVLEIVKESTPLIPVFERAYYTGWYSNQDGLLFEQSIQLIQGFDENVQFALTGDDAVLFDFLIIDESFILTIKNEINEIQDRSHLVFSVVAEKNGTLNGQAAIVIELTDYTKPTVLGFEKNSYMGSIQDSVSTLELITLIEGYNDDVDFALIGDLYNFFSVTPTGNTIVISLASAIPEQSIPNNGIIFLELQASAPQAISAYATVVFYIIRQDDGVDVLKFGEAYYTGDYIETEGLLFEHNLLLSEGHTEEVHYYLNGDQSQWFRLLPTESSLTLTLPSPLPEAVVNNNPHLLFAVIAEKSGAINASTTVVISLPGNYSEAILLGFEKNSYMGSIENNVITLEPITLIEGYNDDVNFDLIGDLTSFFSVARTGNTVVVSLSSTIPEQSIPSNGIIFLELRASAPQAISAYTTVAFYIIRQDVGVDVLKFSEAYYTGDYIESEGLLFEHNLLLSEGHTEDVHYYLDGDQSQWFRLLPTESSLTLTLPSPLPEAVVNNNPHLLFTVIAEKSGAINASTTVVISLPGNYSEAILLGFEKNSYMGSIENNVSTLEPITLIEGYNDDVNFDLIGDLTSFFSVERTGNTVVVSLSSTIPEQSIPSNGIIFLELRASAPQAISAYTTVAFYIIRQDVGVDVLKFSEAYYTGDYIESEGLLFEHNLLLSEGHTEDVHYYLDGDQSQWFRLLPTESSLTLTLPSPLPEAVVNNNPHLLFTVIAEKSGAINASTTVVISLPGNYSEAILLGFEKYSYMGSIENNVSSLEPITLIEGYNDDVNFDLIGDLTSFFSVARTVNTVVVSLSSTIPEQSIPSNGIIFLELRASAPQAISAHTTVAFYIIRQDVGLDVLKFGEAYYTGDYIVTEGLLFEHNLLLSEGHTEEVNYYLDGDQSQWFRLLPTESSLTLTLPSPLPEAVVNNNPHLLFAVIAEKSGAINASTTVVISLPGNYSEAILLGFEKNSYMGSIENNVSTLEPITLIEGYNDDVNFDLIGDLTSFFSVERTGNTVVVSLSSTIPEQSIPSNGIIFLELRASAPQAISAYTTVAFYIIRQDVGVDVLKFSEAYYTGDYIESEGLLFEHNLLLSEGHTEDVHYFLDGDQSQWFRLLPTESSLTLTLPSPLPEAVVNNNPHLLFTVIAEKSGAINASTTVVISLPGNYSEAILLGFEKNSYMGSIENNVSTLEPITLIEGYNDDVNFDLIGDLTSFFSVARTGNTVVVSLSSTIPEQSIPSNGIIFLELRASAPQAISAYTTVAFYIIRQDVGVDVLKFSEAYYTGDYIESEGLLFEHNLLLSEGHTEDVHYYLDGDQSQWFRLLPTESSLTLTLPSPLPEAVVNNNPHLLFAVIAEKSGAINASTSIVISLTGDSTGAVVNFSKNIYEGLIQNGELLHEAISVTEYDENEIPLFGEYANIFNATVENGIVTIRSTGSLSFPDEVAYVALELRAGGASAVLILKVTSETTTLPSVSFSSPSYVFRVEIDQTGDIGRVQASADNGEQLTYSTSIENVHLQQRLSVTNEGNVVLTAPVDSGIYSFQIIATTIISRVEDQTTVQLFVEAASMCGNEIVVPPLLILDRDEEEPHANLVVLSETQFGGCHYTLTNRWPENQQWLYVDENGLHARSIDREHESIAFMAQSQVQVELVLHCENDTSDIARFKRDVTPRLDWLGPYDYGNNKWILTDTILYNPRRTLVNLIVNDINDNAPVFAGKDNEPIAVGYPIEELEGSILPRALAELLATDADIGENAALRYWSSEDTLSVAPTTGLVHVKNGARLEHGSRYAVHATDQNGDGLTGSIDILVRLLDMSHIVVMTVQDAFLNDESTILNELSNALGYEVKSLRSVVVSNNSPDSNDVRSRLKRDLTSTNGTSLQIYVYGLIEREPVEVDKLTLDINNNTITATIESTVSLEDHLVSQQTHSGRDTGLLVSTIVLSVLLFILIVVIAIWYILKWRKNNYDKFSDENSLESSKDSVQDIPKPEPPRLNIEELKRSERRLQEMLDAPVEAVPTASTSKKAEKEENSINRITFDPATPIVVQDKLKAADESEDEFGEIQKDRRKSVVTFNENVEKIIHVDDNIDIESLPEYEVYRF